MTASVLFLWLCMVFGIVAIEIPVVMRIVVRSEAS